jgi:hypothetical protein
VSAIVHTAGFACGKLFAPWCVPHHGDSMQSDETERAPTDRESPRERGGPRAGARSRNIDCGSERHHTALHAEAPGPRPREVARLVQLDGQTCYGDQLQPI